MTAAAWSTLLLILANIAWIFLTIRVGKLAARLDKENQELRAQLPELRAALTLLLESPDDSALVSALEDGSLTYDRKEFQYIKNKFWVRLGGISVSADSLRAGYEAIRTAQYAQRLAKEEGRCLPT